MLDKMIKEHMKEHNFYKPVHKISVLIASRRAKTQASLSYCADLSKERFPCPKEQTMICLNIEKLENSALC